MLEEEIKCANCGKSNYTEGIDFNDMSFCKYCCKKLLMAGDKPTKEDINKKDFIEDKIKEFGVIWWKHLDTYNSKKEHCIQDFLTSSLNEAWENAIKEFKESLDD